MEAIVRFLNDPTVPKSFEIDDEPLDVGGSSQVYATSDAHYVLKVVRTELVDKNTYYSRLQMLAQRLRATPSDMFIVPLATLATLDRRAAYGYLMWRVPDYYVPLDKFAAGIAPFWKQITASGSQTTWAFYLRVAGNIARGLKLLDKLKLAHSDLSLKNIYMNPKTGAVAFIDIDSCVLSSDPMPNRITPALAAPEIIQGSTPPAQEAIKHSTAVLLLQMLLLRNVMRPSTNYYVYKEQATDGDFEDEELLLFGQYALFSEDPLDGRHCFRELGKPLFVFEEGKLQRNPILLLEGARWISPLSYRILTPQLQRLTEETLVVGLRSPARRANLEAWGQALEAAVNALCRCPRCRQEVLFPYWHPRGSPGRICALCHYSMNQPVLVLRVLSRDRSDRYRYLVDNDNVLVGTEAGATLKLPGTDQALCSVEKGGLGGQFRLENRTQTTWTVYSPHMVKESKVVPGGQVEVEKDTVILFDPEGNGAFVSEASWPSS